MFASTGILLERGTLHTRGAKTGLDRPAADVFTPGRPRAFIQEGSGS